MSAVAVALPKGVGGVHLGELLKLVGLPSEAEQASKRLSLIADRIVRPITSVIDDLLARAIDVRTAQEFGNVRNEVFPHYFHALRALSDLITIVAPKHSIELAVAESFCELEAEFRDESVAAIGADLRDRAMFTVWTLRKITDLAKEISECAPLNENKDADAELAKEFAFHAIWARFHVDLLIKSIRASKPIYPEVTEPVCDGLRAAVNAYAWIRQGLNLRKPTVEPKLEPIEWDEEDEQLLADSMRDLDRTESN